METSFERFKPRIMNYSGHKFFENKIFHETFENHPLYELSKRTFEENANSFHKINITDRFDNIENHLLNPTASYKNFKERTTKKNEENEDRLLAKENAQLK